VSTECGRPSAVPAVSTVDAVLRGLWQFPDRQHGPRFLRTKLDAASACVRHTMNDWNGLAITAVAVMLSLKPADGSYYTWPFPMTFIHELDLYPLKMYLKTKKEFKAFEIYHIINIHTYVQTDRQTDNIYHAASWVVNMNFREVTSNWNSFDNTALTDAAYPPVCVCECWLKWDSELWYMHTIQTDFDEIWTGHWSPASTHLQRKMLIARRFLLDITRTDRNYCLFQYQVYLTPLSM